MLVDLWAKLKNVKSTALVSVHALRLESERKGSAITNHAGLMNRG